VQNRLSRMSRTSQVSEEGHASAEEPFGQVTESTAQAVDDGGGAELRCGRPFGQLW
jgi:hypothetical protein